MQDRRKLLRVLGYLQRKKGRKLFLRAMKKMKVEAYVDASFAMHLDGKSPTEVMIVIGGVSVFFAS